MNLIQQFITHDDSYRNNVNKVDSRYTRFQERGPIGLMLHSVGTPQPDASVFAGRWNRAGTEVAVHAVLQADGTVYQCLPWNYRGWHAGGVRARDAQRGVGAPLAAPEGRKGDGVRRRVAARSIAPEATDAFGSVLGEGHGVVRHAHEGRRARGLEIAGRERGKVDGGLRPLHLPPRAAGSRSCGA